MEKQNDELPIDACLSDIVASVTDSIPVVLKAPPGAGKTTGVPPALLSAGIANDGQIVLVQPRRLAARASANRIAKLTDSTLGQEIGYHVRFDRKANSKTKLIVVTTGILLRRLNSDPLLEDVACVILDEFHERTLEMDLVLGMLQRIRTTLRPELKLIVMSATLDPQPIVNFLGEARSVVSEGRAFPVEIQYSAELLRERIDVQVADALAQMLKRTDGHILVFLPGLGEIRRTEQTIIDRGFDQNAIVMSLYGDLSPDRQDEVLAWSQTRKIILATNVAETSITIPGVTGVIDSGHARVMRFHANVGMPALRLERISQASADQRAGRAGRTEPGVCMRLWPANMHRSRRELDTPEIERSDFSGAMLTLAAWGERDPAEFPWLSPPTEQSIETARRLLLGLEAIDETGSITTIGEQMMALPLHPRVARFMVKASELGIGESASIAAALLTERDPFRQSGWQSSSGVMDLESDIVDRVDALKSSSNHTENGVNMSAVRQIRNVARQLVRAVDLQTNATATPEDNDAREALMRSLLCAYPDRVARRREPGSERGLMVGGRGVKLDSKSVVRSAEFFLCMNVDSRSSEALVRIASAIRPEWLDSRLLKTVEEHFFHPTSQSVIARRREYFDDLILAESPTACHASESVARILFDHAKRDIQRLFPSKDKEIGNFISRVRFLFENMPELELAKLDDSGVEEVLLSLCQSRTSIEELRRAPWLDHLRARYDYDQQQQIEKFAPATMRVPSGNAIRVQYVDGKPVMEVRLQELFGWTETPRLAGGRVPLQLHLLGPNYRPQQITEDLANFWSVTYMQVRKDLRRRYPKHHWPEDPMTATATRNGLKPRNGAK